MWKSLKTCAIKQILLNNKMLKVNNKSTKTICGISPSLTIRKKHNWRSFWVFIVNFEWILTPSSIISIVNSEHALNYLANFKWYFSIQKLRLKFWSKWKTSELVLVVLFFLRNSVSSIFVSQKSSLKQTKLAQF